MKNMLFACLLAAPFSLFSQKTVQFADPLPPGQAFVKQVDKNHFGAYRSNTSGTIYQFDETGVSIVSTIVAYITREQLRESSTIEVRNGYLFGVVAGDSVPCVLEGERYYYGIRNKQVIIGEGSLSQLTRLDAKTYVLNFIEGGYFEPSLLTFTANGLEIIHGNTEALPEYDKILVVNNITRYNSPVAILAPSEAQWAELKKILFEGERLLYAKEL